MLSLLWRQVAIEWKLYARDRSAMFWAFLFPVLTLLGLGTVFRSGGGPTPTLVRVVDGQPGERDRALGQALADSQIRLLDLGPAEAEARWRSGQTVAQLEPRDGHYVLRLNSYLLPQAGLTAGVVNQAWLVAQARLRGDPEPERIPTVIESPGHARARSYVDFLLPGLIGLNLLTMGLYSVGMVNVAYREKGKFRRLAVTPLPKWIFLSGQILHRLSLVVLQSALLLLVGRLVFGVECRGSYLALAGLVTLGTATFIALGFALSTLADTTEGYAGVSNLAFFPMMFLSGVYFSLDSAPGWLQKATLVLPLSPYLRALRAVFNDGAPLSSHALGLGVLLVWGAVFFSVALKRYRWA